MKRRTMGVIAGTALVGVLALTLVSGAFAMGGFGPSLAGPTPTSTAVSGPAGPYGPGGVRPGGMMGTGYGPGAGFGPGMMGRSGYGPGWVMSGWAQGNPNQPAISIDQAQKDVQADIDRIGNADLTIDEVMEFQNNFYAIVKEKSTGTGAFEVLIDKWTGVVTPEPGPNMMWNTKYGMMGSSSWMGQRMGYTVPTGPMTVSADQARQIVQRWLDQNQPGSTTEAPDQFYGYYTVHTLKSGKVTGMLSVNGYTGQVWYHTWHGSFIQVKDLGGES